MSLREAFVVMANAPKSPNCRIAKIREALGAEDREFLDTILGVEKSTVVAKLLRGEGHAISNHTVMRHVRGDCACEPR